MSNLCPARRGNQGLNTIFLEVVLSVYVNVKCLYIFITGRQCSSPHVMQIHLRKVALIVQYVDDSLRFLSDQINGWLVVVKLNNCPVNSLTCILRLLQFEDVLVEVKLKRFVRIIYAQLFKAVYYKILFKLRKYLIKGC